MPNEFQDHFSGHAASYATYRPRYPRELFEWLADHSPSRGLAWDCATGNGQAACSLAELFSRVEATDASASQIANASPHPRICYRVATADASGLEGGSVDLVTIAQALHWMPFDAFYAEVKRVLKPAGLFAAWAYNFYHCGEDLNPILESGLFQPIASHWPPERKWCDERYRTVPFPFDEIQAPPFETRVQWNVDALLGYLATWSGVRRWRKAVGDEPWNEFEARLHEAFPSGVREFRIPLDLRAGRVPAHSRPDESRTLRA